MPTKAKKKTTKVQVQEPVQEQVEEQPGTAVIPVPPVLPDKYENIDEIANSVVKSGFYKDVATFEQARTKLLYGQALGFAPAFALQRLLVVNGQVTMMGEAVLVKWKEEGIRWYRFYYNRAGENIAKPETTDKKLFGCGVILWGKDGKLLTVGMDGETPEPVTFDMERAAQAQLSGKDNWRHYPDRMLWYRVVAFASRDFTPGLTQGMMTTEEAQDIVYTKVVDVTVPDGPEGASKPTQQGEECPIHPGCYFKENPWHDWTHPTEEKNDKGKTIYCYRDKVKKEAEAKAPIKKEETGLSKEAEALLAKEGAVPAKEPGEEEINPLFPDWGKTTQKEFFAELDRIIAEKKLSNEVVKEIMFKKFKYSRRTEIVIAKRNAVIEALISYKGK